MENSLSMREIQNVSLEILKIVADVCDSQGLKYSLAWGTLIGAVRHHDYIPWDDDVDILMSRPDYCKLKEYFCSHADDLYPLKLFDNETNIWLSGLACNLLYSRRKIKKGIKRYHG